MVTMMLGDIEERCTDIGHPLDDIDVDDFEQFNIDSDSNVGTSLNRASADRFMRTGKTKSGVFTIFTHMGKVTVYTEAV